MSKVLRTTRVFVFLLSLPLLGQSADQEIVSVFDSPDPVTPGATLSYTVTIRNNGPDPATNGGLNINLPASVTHTTDAVPPGWTCFWLGSNGTCNTPSFAPGTTASITINVDVNAALAAFPDQNLAASFFPSGTTIDPNSSNNNGSASTTVDSPQVDLTVTASDAPDPVFPDGNVTYSVVLTNGGPDPATSVNFNVVPNSSLRFQSTTVPAGWSCTLPSVGAINATFTCSRAAWAPGSDEFTIVFSANDEQFGINDTTFQTNFNVAAGASNETDFSDNGVTVTTAYGTPDADVSVAVSDSPDPVSPDGNITYTVTVANAGPDTAPIVNLSSFGANNLRFVSAIVPAGWSCTLPASGTQTTSLACTLGAGMVNDDSDVLTFVMQADDDILGINDGTILFGFSANSSISDPVPGNNSETESTAYVTPDADVSVSASDSPDPVGPDGDITYTVTVSNAGPDAAQAQLAVPMNGTLKFTSITVPAGFTCTSVPPSGSATSFGCSNPLFESGASAVFTIVLRADQYAFPFNDQVINQQFSVTGTVSDPNAANNAVTVSTNYDVPDANLSITASDSPDPVSPGANITYAVDIANAGEDDAINATLTMPLASGLLFQSLTAAPGFSCTTPAIGTAGTITCTAATFVSGAAGAFTLIAQVDAALNVGPDGTIEQTFTIGSDTRDPLPENNAVTVMTAYLTPDADLSASTDDAPDPVAPGAALTYTQSVTNSGPDAATNVTFSQALAADVTFTSLAAPPGWTCVTPAVGAIGTITCSRASMAAGATDTFVLVVDVVATSGTIVNTVTAGSETFDADSGDDTDTTTTTVEAPPAADLAVTKSAATTTAAPGTDIQYTIVVTNNGPDAATNVVMTDVLPASLLFESIVPQPGFTCTTPAVGAAGTITCTAPSVAAGTSATFTLNVLVDAEATGSIVNTATATADTPDPNAANGSSTAPVVTVIPPSANLSIAKSTTASTAREGETFDYTITLSNGGPDTATSIEMTDVLPAGLLFESIVAAPLFTCTTPAAGTNGTITCTTASMTNFATAVFTITVRVAPGATGSATINTALATSALPDPDDSNNAGSATPVILAPAEAILTIEKSTAATSVTTGETIVYTIVVSNTGPSAATIVVVTDSLPAGLELVAATPTQGACSGTATVTCTIGSLATGGTASITLSARVTATSGTIANTATVTAAEGAAVSDTTPAIPVTVPAVAAIPTLSEWALLAMALLLGGLAAVRMRA